jgi:hypothetical protein
MLKHFRVLPEDREVCIQCRYALYLIRNITATHSLAFRRPNSKMDIAQADPDSV